MEKRHLMQKIQAIIMTALMLLICFLTNDYVSGTETDESVKFFSDNRGNFWFTNEGNLLYKMDGNGKTLLAYSGDKQVDNMYSTESCTYVVSNTEHNNAYIAKIRGGAQKGVFLDDINVKDNCFVADDMEMMYAVDKNDPNYLIVFGYDGYEIKRYNALGNITGIFLDKNTNDIFAVSRSGLFNVTANFSEIGAVVPQGDFIINGELCTDSEGNAYKFDPLNGFSKVLESDYDLLCPTADDLYGVKGKTVYRLDTNGEETAYINLSVKPEKLLSSKNCLAYTFENRITLIHLSDMTEIPKKSDDLSVPEEEKSIVSQAVSTGYDTNEVNYEIGSEILEISEEYIFLDYPMTLAELKRSISYNDNELTVKNYNGKTVTGGNVGTNWILTFSGAEERIFYTVLPGDTTGEGSINSRDVKNLSEYLLDKGELLPAFLFAADINEDSVIDLLDLYKIYQMY